RWCDRAGPITESHPDFFIGGCGSFELWKSLLPPQTHELPMSYATYSYSMDLAPRKRGLALVGFGGNVID
ncbi:MAG: hypothetical protein VXW10_00005, partial [Pseudomonadota bacterium]|nr:hypothetical protein [Pseudomonadota bacterium]